MKKLNEFFKSNNGKDFKSYIELNFNTDDIVKDTHGDTLVGYIDDVLNKNNLHIDREFSSMQGFMIKGHNTFKFKFFKLDDITKFSDAFNIHSLIDKKIKDNDFKINLIY